MLLVGAALAQASLRGAHNRASCVTPIPVMGAEALERRQDAPGRSGTHSEGREGMTEAAGGGRDEVERRLVERSLEDGELRRRLLDDPKGTLEQELGRGLPAGVEVRVVQESADTIYLVLPSASALGDQGGELSEEELEAVAGGLGDRYTDNDDTCGRACDTSICTSLLC
jgi:hypothetical protein